ncbi:ABC transporter permease [Streptomyces caniscabiei]|uniref:ABC transporter permease n=1 Tax=Streptomyces caniscabiei TaxID=2746961 RepID=A0A927QDU6_9ACTN|nr:ABC transporter permease [Streptomyces caniscabiei]MBD9702157.1 ABC transporter permease [Streptomyces caniscabiei]MBD9722681.1 ABC transporter permease [Streptomyces caniscabiei]MDX3508704.1 ABC transporter permease [Streptomyces caniscabiei]MDX3719873.1 ABC transporter permease [Streptomyces caniscabiei]MDX3730465.1 ABC transporter permease [Streptomyces caniscabiei]
MTSPTKAEGSGSAVALDPELESTAEVAKGEKKLEGRSPGQLMWQRFKRDRTGVISACVVIFFFAVAALAPVISSLYGKNPYTLYAQEPDYPFLLDDFAMPTGSFGGMSGDFWFGVEPKLGRDVFTMLLYGMRTSLYMAVIVTVFSVVTGVLIGMIGGYFGGRVDYWVGRVTDFFLGFPSQLFFIAFMPVVTALFVDPRDETPTYLRAVAIILVMWFLGWMGLARLVRSSVLSLREREFVEAAKVSGASPWRIVRKEILPNIVTPILVQATYILPSTILTIAFLSFVGVGFTEPTPDWGRMFAVGSEVYEQDPMFMFFPGVAMVVFVLCFNLLGDSVRDAFDPKTGR